jgi:predicted MFS family arabinose efflux permease
MEQRAGQSAGSVFGAVFLPYALGHFLSSLLRNVNAVLAPRFVTELGLGPAQLGLLSSVFFFAFALAQLPVGMALDRHGPRRVQATLLLLACAGTLGFASARSYAPLVLARFVMGLGLGGSFMAGVTALAARVAAPRLPSMNGYLIAAGGLGAAASTLPVRTAAALWGWRALFCTLALALLLIAAFIWLATPRAVRRPRAPAGTPVPTLGVVWRQRAFRRTIALLLVPHAVFFGVQGMWIGRWLADAAGFSGAAVAYLLYLSMAAVIFGAIGVGFLTQWAVRRGVGSIRVARAGVALFVLVQAGMVLAWPGSFQLLAVLFALTGSITGIEYTLVAQTMPPGLTGRAATALNLLIFAGAFIVQAGVGMVLGCWTPDHAGHYPAVAYRAAFGLLIAAQLPGLVQCLLFSRHHKDHHETAALRTTREGTAGHPR